MFILAFGSRGAASIFVGRMLLVSQACRSQNRLMVVDQDSVFLKTGLREVLGIHVVGKCSLVEQANNNLY